VQPINSFGQNVTPPGTANANPRKLPQSTIYGFNGTFPGPRINAEYGRAVLVRFENHLDEANGYDRMDFGAPNHAFLTHLHNGHTACESDGNPHHAHRRFSPLGRHHYEAAYEPGEWLDNLYLNYPAGGDDREKQSFLWFHDHVHGHTGANVYRGMVGLMPIYDPKIDRGDETDPTACAFPAGAPTTRTAPSTSTTTSRSPSTTVASTTASRGTRTPTPDPAKRTRNGGAGAISVTCPATASSATCSPSMGPPTRCWRSTGASTACASSTRRSRASTTSSS
jgi:hypothetical protein